MHMPAAHGTRTPKGSVRHTPPSPYAPLVRITLLLGALLALTLLAGCREPGAFDGGWGAGLPSSITIEKTPR